jgi:hypothetical protein
MKIPLFVVPWPTHVGTTADWRIPDFVDQARN